MKIDLVSEHASPLAPLGGADAGGQNVHVAALATALARRGHEVTVYTRRDSRELPDAVPLADGVTVEHVPAGPPWPLPKDDLFVHMPGFARWLEQRWYAGRPDVVHAHFWMSGVAAVMAARRRQVPVVQTFHALGRVKRRYQASADTSPPERIRAEAAVVRAASAVIATCTDEVGELAAYGAQPDRMYVVPSGVDCDRFSPDGPSGHPARTAGRSGAGGTGTDRSGTDRSGTDGSGTDRSGTDRSGTGRSGAGGSGTDRSGTGRSGTGGSGTDRSGTGGSGTDRSGTDGSGTGRSGAGGSGTDRSGTDRSGTGRHGGTAGPDGGPRVLTLGRLVPRKGVDTVIIAMSRVPGAELIVAGGPDPARLDDDPEVRRLRRIAVEAGVAGRVTFTGRVPHDEVPGLLRSADVMVSDPWYEPFGIVPLEAMACGTAVVAAAVGGHLDTVADGVTGLLVPPRDPAALASRLRDLLADPRRRREFGAAGVARVRSRYTWDRIATETEAVYAGLRQDHPVSAP